MPYKFETDKVPMPEGKDRRKKISDLDKIVMREMRDEGISYNKIAKALGCSKKSVMFVINPDMLIREKEAYKERRKDGRYYKKDKHTVQMREHRSYKNGVLKSENKKQ